MSDLLTPHDLARAIGTSESSVRRWLDAGDVAVTRTAGGHRRIALAEALRFIRDRGATVVRPEILGVGGPRRRMALPRDAGGAEELYNALRSGRREVARGLLTGWYAAGRAVSEILDGPVRVAMERIGELWTTGAEGILQEHSATLACVEAVMHLRELIPEPSPRAPLAVGGAPEGDFYLLPSLAASATLREAGLRERSFGANTPLQLLGEAARREQARLVWVSITAETGVPVRQPLEILAGELMQIGAELVVGGQRSAGVAPVAVNVRRMSSMGELSAFAASLRRSG